MRADTELCRGQFEAHMLSEKRSSERFNPEDPEHLEGTDDDGWPEFRVRDYFTWPTEEQWRAFRAGWLAHAAVGQPVYSKSVVKRLATQMGLTK